jgi:serine/threonine protein kinase
MSKSQIVDKRQTSNVNNELTFLRASSHPFVVGYLGSFQTKTHLFVVLEYVAGGELYSYLYSKETLEPSAARVYLAEVISAIGYIHSLGFIYRDLKPENILIAQTGHLKLVDFGFVKRLGEEGRTYSMCGTTEYMAPEVVAGTGYGLAADWWSVGILLYEMLVGSSPFVANDPYEIYNKVLSVEPVLPHGLDSSASSLITLLLMKNPNSRLTESGVKAHPFFSRMKWKSLNSLTPPHLPQLVGSLDSSAFNYYPDEKPTTREWVTAHFPEF